MYALAAPPRAVLATSGLAVALVPMPPTVTSLWLQEDADAVFDLQRGASRALGLPKRSVAGLGAACEALLSVQVDKTEQTSDWCARPLSDSQLAYAAMDAQVLLPLARALGRDAWASVQLSSRSTAVAQPRRPTLTDEEREARKAAGLALREQRRAARPPAPPPPPTISTRALPLAGIDALVSSKLLGAPLGGRGKVLRLCAGAGAPEDESQDISPAGGGDRNQPVQLGSAAVTFPRTSHALSLTDHEGHPLMPYLRWPGPLTYLPTPYLPTPRYRLHTVLTAYHRWPGSLEGRRRVPLHQHSQLTPPRWSLPQPLLAGASRRACRQSVLLLVPRALPTAERPLDSSPP